jgi:hypothetical protein
MRFPERDSFWWPVLVGVAFTVTELASVSPRMGLSWDEVVYVSQVSRHAPAAWFDPPRARGGPLIVAPVAFVTSSVVALRIYLSLLSGMFLVLALLVWRPLRAGWVLGLAGVAFGGLWVAQYYGPQAMPDMWSALGALAAVGFFARYVYADGGWGSLAGVLGCVAGVTLVRPGDAVYLSVPLVLALLVVPAWRARLWRGRMWRLGAAVAGGLVAGGIEWVAEAIVRFGSVGARLHGAAAEQGGFGVHFAWLDELKALNGPTLCRPCTVGYRQPELDLWWLALPVLVVLGVIVARVASRGPGMLCAVCGFCLAAQYLFMINYSAPRFLLPAYAVLAIPVADGLAWLIAGSAVRESLRPAMAALVGCALVLQVVSQHLVLDHEVGGTIAFHDDYTVIVSRLDSLGVRPPCMVSGVQYIPIAWYAGCASAGWAGRPVLLVGDGERPPAYARKWHAYRITGTTVLHVTAYLP